MSLVVLLRGRFKAIHGPLTFAIHGSGNPAKGQPDSSALPVKIASLGRIRAKESVFQLFLLLLYALVRFIMLVVMGWKERKLFRGLGKHGCFP